MPTRIEAVIFDFDGVIVDSESAEFEAHRLIYERCGVELTPDDWCHQIGIYVEDYVGRWAERLAAVSAAAPSAAEFETEKRRLVRTLLADTPMRGVVALLDCLAASDVKAAVASTSPARWVVSEIERLGLSRRFQAIVTADDVSRRKPAPDVYLEAARRLRVRATRAIAIEDSAPGIASARAAGMKTVAIPHWLTERHDLSAADLRVAHAGELTLERLDALLARSA
jgi:HAD superfamily hydrolase (TIGR01509 family)